MPFSRVRTGIATALRGLIPDHMNAPSTFKTSLGFLATLIEPRLPERLRASAIETIFNYLPLTSSLVTAGQPTELQLAAGFIILLDDRLAFR